MQPLATLIGHALPNEENGLLHHPGIRAAPRREGLLTRFGAGNASQLTNRRGQAHCRLRRGVVPAVHCWEAGMKP